MRSFYLSFMIIGFTFINSASASTEQNFEWIDLIPLHERQRFFDGQQMNIDHTGPALEQNTVGTVRTELDGQKITIPGFVIPLEGTEMNVTEFLLVPYFGACIHVPPPPPNQIIYVKYPAGAPMTKLWDVVYVTGEIEIETVSTDLAETGYLLNAVAVTDYQE